ncbi:hypothetical protein UY3_13804 [Chelonia mydas]|uniref:Uncharacterized protein n=1 Tax=Chelonia mydas TaxID=8469 RepID=M7BA82_CHEMY|nr:hypothetical protein UY3_13804 [Chelonia mydas]
MATSFYKTSTDTKKPEMSMGARARVQKRRPIYTYFAKEAAPLPNPTFHPEIEQKKQENFMGPLPVVKEEKDCVGMEEESVYKDMAAEGSSEDSHVKNQPRDPESWKDGNTVTITKPGPHRITALVCDEWPTEPEEHDQIKAT